MTSKSSKSVILPLVISVYFYFALYYGKIQAYTKVDRIV